jgi:hypothetical protein
VTAINPHGRMGCPCCNNEYAAEIDIGLRRGLPLGVLSMCFGVSPDSLQRHQ